MHSSFVTSALLALFAIQTAASPAAFPQNGQFGPHWYETQTGLCPPVHHKVNDKCNGKANRVCDADGVTVVSRTGMDPKSIWR